MRDVKQYDYKTDEAEFLDSGVRAKLVASAAVTTNQGKDAINFLYLVEPGQKAVSARTRDQNNKVDVGGTFVLTQQNFDQEGQVKFTLNLMRHVLGYSGDGPNEINLPPDQSGMTNLVLLSTEIKQVDGKNVVRVAAVAKADPTMTVERVAEMGSKWGHLFAESKKGPFKFDKKATAGTAGGSGSSGTLAPPARDMGGSVGGAVAASDEVPF